jgi:hypothetical protein
MERRGLVLETRKCTHFYHYYMHEQFGMLHVRVQSWLPFSVELGRPLGQRYYWSASQTEFATDLCFKDAASLQKLYPQFIHHAIRSFNSSDVLRFLGKRFPQMFRSGEVKSTLKNRPEGVRLRHSVKSNSLKLYDKEGSVLRVETTIVCVEEFRVYRPNIELLIPGQSRMERFWKPSAGASLPSTVCATAICKSCSIPASIKRSNAVVNRQLSLESSPYCAPTV